MSQQRVVTLFFGDAPRAAALAEALSGQGCTTLVPENTDELHAILSQQRIDLLIIEQQLNGFFTGLEILERLTGDLIQTAKILVADAQPEISSRAARLDARVLSPSLGNEELCREMQTAQPVNYDVPSLIPLLATQVVQQSDVIRPLPQLLIRICSYLDDESASLAQLAKDIAVDPRITAELLKFANSTAFGLRRKAASVFEAVNYLGIKRTVSLVLTKGVIESQMQAAKSLPRDLRNWHSLRSVMTASAAAVFAGHDANLSPETAYVLGLLQDIGVLVMAHAWGDSYQRLLLRARQVGHLRLETCERQEFGMTHAEVSAALLQKWNMPPFLVSLVLKHHAEDAMTSPTDAGLDQRFLRVMRIGEAFANLQDACVPQRIHLLNSVISRLPIETEQVRICLAEATARAAESSAIFSLPDPDAASLKNLVEVFWSQRTKPPTEEVTASETPADCSTEPDEESPAYWCVIEDDPVTVEVVTCILTSLGLTVRACDDAQTALQLALDAEGILCDVHLGAEHGPAIVRELRSRGISKPILMLTSDASRGTVMEAIQAGVTDYVLKPINGPALVEKVERQRAILGARVGRAAQPASACVPSFAG